MSEDQIRISAFKKALRQYTSEGVVDLDKNYSYKFDFQIHRYEDVLRNSRMAAPPHRWSYYRIGFLKQGEGDVVTGIYKFKARKNTFFVIPSRVITSSKNWTTDSQGFVLLFNPDFFLQNNISHQMLANKNWLSGSVRPDIYLPDDQAEEVERILEAIMQEKKLKDKANTEFIAVKILELLILGERLSGQMKTGSENLPVSDVIRQFIDMLDLHFPKEHSVKFYADQLSMHPNHLNSLVKKQTGMSAKESIQNRILLEIKYLLHSTKLPIKEIANQMGFNDPNYFTTFFRRFENRSPVSYRSAFA
jgi:AraC family transcriptional regulator, transcriptional activator of pobA